MCMKIIKTNQNHIHQTRNGKLCCMLQSYNHLILFVGHSFKISKYWHYRWIGFVVNYSMFDPSFLGDMIEYCLARSHLCDACLTDMHKNILMDALLLGSYFIIIKQQQTHNYARWWIFLSWNPISHHLPSWKSYAAKWGLEKEYRFHLIWYLFWFQMNT